MRWLTATYTRYSTWAREQDPEWSPHDVLIPAVVGVVIVAAGWVLGVRM